MTEILENSNEKSSWGGAREGAGRKIGSTNKATREKKEAETYFKQRVIDSIESIINSQMNLAQGVQMLFRIDTETDEKGRQTKSKPQLVTNQDEIENYLSGDYEDKESYYFITTERPDNKALDSLIDRVFGKSTQHIDHTTQGDKITYTDEQLQTIAKRYIDSSRNPGQETPD